MTLKRRDVFKAIAGAALTASSRGQQPIPPHPRDLVFDEPNIELPDRESHRKMLSGGATGYFVESHDIPLVTVSVNLLGGTYVVPAGSEGLAGLTASQLRLGGTTSRSAQEFNDSVALLAAEMYSVAKSTTLTATVTCLTTGLDESLELLFDSLKNPAFDPNRLEISKSAAAVQFARRNDRLDEILEREFNRLVRGTHFSANGPTQESVQSITPDAMRRYHAENYDPKRMYFAVSGDFDTDTIARRLNSELASGWPTNVTAAPAVPAPTHRPVPGVYMVDKSSRDINQSHVVLGHVGITEAHPDAGKVQLMNAALSSRISTRVRSDEGLAYTAYSEFQPGTYYPGLFRSVFQSGNLTCAQAATIVVEEIRRMQSDRISPDELASVRSQTINGIAEYFENVHQSADRFALDELVGRSGGYWQGLIKEATDVTADDILSVAQRHLRPDDLVILAVGNQAELLIGNPDRPQYSFEKLAGDAGIRFIPLPDPLTLEYPS